MPAGGATGARCAPGISGAGDVGETVVSIFERITEFGYAHIRISSQDYRIQSSPPRLLTARSRTVIHRGPLDSRAVRKSSRARFGPRESAGKGADGSGRAGGECAAGEKARPAGQKELPPGVRRASA